MPDRAPHWVAPRRETSDRSLPALAAGSSLAGAGMLPRPNRFAHTNPVVRASGLRVGAGAPAGAPSGRRTASRGAASVLAALASQSPADAVAAQARRALADRQDDVAALHWDLTAPPLLLDGPLSGFAQLEQEFWQQVSLGLQPAHLLRAPGSDACTTCVAASPCARYLALGTARARVLVFDLKLGALWHSAQGAQSDVAGPGPDALAPVLVRASPPWTAFAQEPSPSVTRTDRWPAALRREAEADARLAAPLGAVSALEFDASSSHLLALDAHGVVALWALRAAAPGAQRADRAGAVAAPLVAAPELRLLLRPVDWHRAAVSGGAAPPPALTASTLRPVGAHFFPGFTLLGAQPACVVALANGLVGLWNAAPAHAFASEPPLWRSSNGGTLPPREPPATERTQRKVDACRGAASDAVVREFFTAHRAPVVATVFLHKATARRSVCDEPDVALHAPSSAALCSTMVTVDTEGLLCWWRRLPEAFSAGACAFRPLRKQRLALQHTLLRLAPSPSAEILFVRRDVAAVAAERDRARAHLQGCAGSLLSLPWRVQRVEEGPSSPAWRWSFLEREGFALNETPDAAAPDGAPDALRGGEAGARSVADEPDAGAAALETPSFGLPWAALWEGAVPQRRLALHELTVAADGGDGAHTSAGGPRLLRHRRLMCERRVLPGALVDAVPTASRTDLLVLVRFTVTLRSDAGEEVRKRPRPACVHACLCLRRPGTCTNCACSSWCTASVAPRSLRARCRAQRARRSWRPPFPPSRTASGYRRARARFLPYQSCPPRTMRAGFPAHPGCARGFSVPRRGGQRLRVRASLRGRR